jgi:hypothetical protein
MSVYITILSFDKVLAVQVTQNQDVTYNYHNQQVVSMGCNCYKQNLEDNTKNN